MELYPGWVSDRSAVVFGGYKAIPFIIQQGLPVRTFPVVPRTAGVAVFQAVSLQIVKWPAVTICVVPWIGIDIIATPCPVSDSVSFRSGHGNEIAHFMEGFPVCFILRGIFSVFQACTSLLKMELLSVTLCGGSLWHSSRSRMSCPYRKANISYGHLFPRLPLLYELM